MRDKYVITSIILFVVVQTYYFWEIWIGLMLLPIWIAIIITFIVLVFNLISKLWRLSITKLQDKELLISFAIQAIIISVTIFFPFGMINFHDFEEKDIIVAHREGVGGCGSYLKFKIDKTYIDREVCFGVFEVRGKYEIKGDTITFLSGSNHDYAVIKHDKFGDELACFKNDSARFIFEITKLELNQK
jgi:hypothetical protein